jgi:hypothetical protein
MKKFLFTTCVVLVILSGCAYPRQTNNALATGKLKAVPKKNQYLNDIHIRAVRDFATRFDSVDNATWHVSGRHFIAVFTCDSTQVRAVYDNLGHLQYIMKYYYEPKLKKDIRAIVKSTYYDYKIFIIQEIQKPDDQPVYVVNLQGETDWIKAKVYAGSMEVLEQFKKSK